MVERPGFPPGPPVERIDFEEHAQLLTRELRPGDHLVGHSYGVVVSLLAAALGPERLRSQIYLEAAHRLATAAAIIRSLDDLTPEVLAGGDCD